MTARFPEIIEFPTLPPPQLAPNQLHLLVASLESLAKYREQAFAVINPDEQCRAERFINPRHGDNFRIVRGTLRMCLSTYLHLPAQDIQFDFNEYGKPEISPAQNQQALQFNVSHSHHMAAFIFGNRKKVGVDIEFNKPLKNLSGLANHVCSPQELEEFNTMEHAQRQDAFFHLWTRKEAFIKAKGQGLSMGLRSIYIGFDTTSATRRIQYRGEWLDNWLVKDLPYDGNYKLAVATEI
jgi:4'-phosphopantetheinyl transferase